METIKYSRATRGTIKTNSSVLLQNKSRTPVFIVPSRPYKRFATVVGGCGVGRFDRSQLTVSCENVRMQNLSRWFPFFYFSTSTIKNTKKNRNLYRLFDNRGLDVRTKQFLTLDANNRTDAGLS